MVYQLDYIAPGLEVGFDGVVFGDYLSALRHFRVWDYSWCGHALLLGPPKANALTHVACSFPSHVRPLSSTPGRVPSHFRALTSSEVGLVLAYRPNVVALASDHGIKASYCPLGFAPSFDYAGNAVDSAIEDAPFDLVFYGAH